MRLTTDGYQHTVANTDDIDEFYWQDDSVCNYVLELNDASTLILTVSGNDSYNGLFTESISIPFIDWANTLLITLDNNSQFLTKLQSVNNTVDGNPVGDLNAPNFNDTDGIAITFLNSVGQTTPFRYEGSFSKSDIGATSFDDWNLQFDFVQVVPEPGTNTPPVAPTASNITVNSSTVNINWSADTNGNWYVESKTDLTATNWTEIAGPLVNSGGTVSYGNAVSDKMRFFRLINK